MFNKGLFNGFLRGIYIYVWIHGSFLGSNPLLMCILASGPRGNEVMLLLMLSAQLDLLQIFGRLPTASSEQCLHLTLFHSCIHGGVDLWTYLEFNAEFVITSKEFSVILFDPVPLKTCIVKLKSALPQFFAMKPNSKDNVVIGGISGRFPKSRNLQEFMENLLSGEDMIGEVPSCWNAALNKFPSRMGRLGDVDKFDAEYFQISEADANEMDPRLRFLLELTHEAIMDAGSKTGVFIGTLGEDTRLLLRSGSDNPNFLSGTFFSMLANQISFNFDFQGPSLVTDTACSSSLVALKEAMLNITSGHCDAAIVAGVEITLDSDFTKRFTALSMLSSDGKCKAFDISANGYVRSEAAVVVFICKESFARRSYAKVLNAKVTTDGSKVQGIFFPSGSDQEQLLREVYAEAGIEPKNVSYVEAHGTGTLAGDPQEVNAIDRVFCTVRHSGPLLIGSVKSNMGHSEAASGFCGLAKVILAAQYGTIPGNLHFNQANPEIPGITSGRIKVVDQNTPWIGGIVGVSAFGFGGSNAHVILDVSISENKTVSSTIPWLIPFSATTSKAVDFALSTVRDRERIGLLQLIQNTNIPGHRFRGYCIPEVCQMEINELNSTNGLMETWFVFSGIGSQWNGMGRDLLVFEAFRQAFENAIDVLKHFGVDLKQYYEDTATYNTANMLYHTACICAIEIALVELLSSIEIAPHKIFGHSLGELACAYADGCYNAEETLLTTCELFQACVESNLPPGAMASVGLRWDDKEMPWKDTIPSCYNAIDNMTVAGSAASIKTLMADMKTSGIFAREVNSQGFPFHSVLMQPAEAQMTQNIVRLNLPTKTRSHKWISTSQISDEIKVLTGSYFVNNIISPVLFHTVVQRIPSHAVVIEVSPHGLFQTILKRSLHETCVSIALTDRNQKNVPFFLRSVGKLFISGLQPKINQLYPELKFPVRSAALPLSPIIQWNHNDNWKVAQLDSSGGMNVVQINLATLAHQFYSGYKINDHRLFPTSGFLVIIWRVLAEKAGTSMNHPVTFENIIINRVCFTSTENVTKFVCNIHASGDFEVSENGKSVVTGSVKFEEPEMYEKESLVLENDKLFTQAEVYERFKKAGYEFSGSFKSLLEVDVETHAAKTIWEGNWVQLLESLFQLEIFSNLSNQALVPARIEKVTIDRECLKNLADEGTPTEILIYRDENLKVVYCAGIEFRGIQLLPIKCFDDVEDDRKNLETIFTSQSLSSFMIGLNKQLAVKNIVKCHFAVDPNILELSNIFTSADVDTNNTTTIGVEFSGIISGQKVVGMARFEATTAQLISVLHWRIPDNWSLLDAITVPTAYATAYYALIVRGTLKHKENILIQYGDEAVGEAAIAIALDMKCTVFTTIRFEENKSVLLNRFPALNPAKVLNSRLCHNLEKLIQIETNGEGVNVVLNSSSGNLMRVSIRCVAEYGRYLQLFDGGIKNASDFRSDKKKFLETTIGLSIFLRSVSFHGICNNFVKSSREEECNSVHSELQEGIGLGIVKPLSIKHFKHTQLKEADWFKQRPFGLEKIVLEME